MNKHLEQAIENLRSAAIRYGKPERYYNGEHDLRFATEKFENTFGTLFREFALNLCPAVCDAMKDKLRVTGFSVESVSGGNATVRDRSGAEEAGAALSASIPATYRTLPHGRVSARVDTVGEAARAIWMRNRMPLRAGEVHKEALKCGDAFVIVWPDERGRARFFPNRAANMAVAYDEEDAGLILWAAKAWLTADKHYRLNLFCPDRIEKYVSKEKSEGVLPEAKAFVPIGSQKPNVQSPKNSDREPWTLDIGPWTVANPYGVVPVFHFANNADLGTLGRSELEGAIPIQDGLNKAVLDMLVAMEFSAFRQRWAAGIEVTVDADGKQVAPFQSGLDKIWIADNPSARFGDFEASQLEQFLKVKDGFRTDIASVTGTPLHYFMQTTRALPSGESLRKAETRFIAKVRDRQEAFGQVWADAMAFALRIEGHSVDSRLITQWEDPSPLSEREVLENLLLKRKIGLPVEDALVEAGYGSADAKDITEENR